MNFDFFIFHELTAFKATTVSCTTLHLYYTILCLDEEVTYIWTKRWTAGKIIYLLTRYLGSIFLILASLGTVLLGWESNEVPEFKTGGIIGYLIKSCLSRRLYSGLGAMIILLAEVILMMRVHALYGSTRRTLYAFVMLTLLLFGFNMLQLILNLELWDLGRINFQVVPAQAGDGCNLTEPVSGIAWAVTSFIELIMFAMVLYKVVQMNRSLSLIHTLKGRSPSEEGIITLIARDSVVYFAVIFSICLFGTISAFMSYHSSIGSFWIFFAAYRNAYQTIVITIITILAPKMLINLRAEYYGPVGIIATQLSWDAQGAEYST